MLVTISLSLQQKRFPKRVSIYKQMDKKPKNHIFLLLCQHKDGPLQNASKGVTGEEEHIQTSCFRLWQLYNSNVSSSGKI